jgi:hypothetical protein
MTMQYDVKTSKIQGSGSMVTGRCRLKQGTIIGTGTAGQIDFFDTVVTPTAATYGRSGTTVTVTSVAHGLTTGERVGIAYYAAAGVSPVSGNYTITKLTADTFAITDLNSGTISGGTTCHYVDANHGNWLMGLNTSTGVQPFQLIIPGEGILCTKGIYSVSTNILSTQVTYG